MKTVIAILTGCLLTLAAGCESQKIPPAKQIRILKQEKKQLQNQIKQSIVESEQLKKHIESLTDLPAEANIENLYYLQKIKINR